jgi:hypothetical protein
MKLQQMQLSAVAFVLLEAILWKMRAKVTHHSIPRHLGDDTGRRDAQTVAIPIDDRRLWKWKWKNRQPFNKGVVRRSDEHFNGGTHRRPAVVKTGPVNPPAEAKHSRSAYFIFAIFKRVLK